MKRMQEPSERKSKKKTLMLEETLETRPPVPLDSSASSKSVPSDTPLNSNLKQLSSSLPQPSSTYTNSEPHNSNPPSPPLQLLMLTTITLPVSEALLLNEPISPPFSTSSSPPYYDISSDPDQPETINPPSPTLAQLQANVLSNQTPYVPETSMPSPSEPQTVSPSELPTEPTSETHTTQTSDPPTETTPTSLEPINPASEPEPTFPTLEEWMTSEVFKLNGLSQQVRNDYIREAEERLEAHLAREAEEKAHQEAKEKARLEVEEKARKEAKEKVATEAVAAEVESKPKAGAEEAARIAAEESAMEKEVALTQGLEQGVALRCVFHCCDDALHASGLAYALDAQSGALVLHQGDTFVQPAVTQVLAQLMVDEDCNRARTAAPWILK
ncbi:eukaryotic translation initiation factor 4 gamma-like [Lathyrus oleraceus]|uniref:eukaryotic translation initiation factor 4 gamma-like n=1 Tax=Pisum sativum TaxID=3888 RepID=UPI0021D02F68|nr:eukaryotic translation initiation factor 4 gamma-like [Pisum sativum]